MNAAALTIPAAMPLFAAVHKKKGLPKQSFLIATIAYLASDAGRLVADQMIEGR